MIYLDSAATAKYRNVDDIVVNTITTAMRDSWMNPSSLYATNVKNKIEQCRKNIADFINADQDEIYFTSGASESNNLAIRGWVNYIRNNYGLCPNIVTTTIEHKSILNLIKEYTSSCKMDVYPYICEVDEKGFVNLELLERILNDCVNENVLVSVCMANNEIGTIQDIRKISNLVHSFNGVLHVDATQAFGKIPIDVKELGIDMLSVSAHKISPVLKGIGFLYKKNGIEISPIICGSQERGLRGGTENTFGIIGLNKAIEYCDLSKEHIDKVIGKRDYFIEKLETRFGCTLNGDRKHRLPNNINVTFPQNVNGESLLYMLGMSDIDISTGSACNSKVIQSSTVLKGIGLSYDDAMKTIRITISDDITYDEIDKVINEIDKALKIIEL